MGFGMFLGIRVWSIIAVIWLGDYAGLGFYETFKLQSKSIIFGVWPQLG